MHKKKVSLVTARINEDLTRKTRTVERIRQGIDRTPYPTCRRYTIQTEIKVLVFAMQIMGVHKYGILLRPIDVIVRPRGKNRIGKNIIIRKRDMR